MSIGGITPTNSIFPERTSRGGIRREAPPVSNQGQGHGGHPDHREQHADEPPPHSGGAPTPEASLDQTA